MRTFILSALALATTAFIPAPAFADDVSDRTAAIHLCRAEVAQQAGVDIAQARLDQVRVRPHTVKVDIDLWRNGDLSNVRCEVSRGGELTIASITPPLATATASAAN